MSSGPGDPRVLFPAVSAFIHDLIKVDATLSSLLTTLASIEADTYAVLNNQTGVVSPASLQVRWHQLVTQILETVITVNKLQPSALIPQHFSEIETIIRQIHSQSPFNPAAKREHNQSFLQLKKEFTEIQNLAKDQMNLRLARFKTDLTIKHESFFRTAQIDKDTKAQAVRDIRRIVDLILRLSSANKRKNEFTAPPECRLLSKFFNDLRMKSGNTGRARSQTPPGRTPSTGRFSIQIPSKQAKPQKEQTRSKTPPAKSHSVSQIPKLVQRQPPAPKAPTENDKASVASDRPTTKRLLPGRSISSESSSNLLSSRKPQTDKSRATETPGAKRTGTPLLRNTDVVRSKSPAANMRTKSSENIMRATSPGPFRGPVSRTNKNTVANAKKISERALAKNTVATSKLRTAAKAKAGAQVAQREPTMESMSSGTDQLVLAVIKAKQQASKSVTLDRLQRDLSIEMLSMEAGEEQTPSDSLEIFNDFEKRLSKYEPMLNAGKRINTLKCQYKSNASKHILSEIDEILTGLEQMSPTESKIYNASKSLAELNRELESILANSKGNIKSAQIAFRSIEKQLSAIRSPRMRSLIEEQTEKLKDAKSTFMKFIEQTQPSAPTPTDLGKLERLTRTELLELYDSLSRELAELEASASQELTGITSLFSAEAEKQHRRLTDLSHTHQQIQDLYASITASETKDFSRSLKALLEREEEIISSCDTDQK